MAGATIIEAMRDDKTLVFGHRGALAAAPMNTLAAFDLAYRQGAHGIEFDVQLAKDGEVVVIHDAAVDATTDGQGQVAAMTLADLKRLDAGSWFAPEFAGERIPTLNEVFDAFGQKLLLNVELKTTAGSAELEAAVATCIRRHDLAGRVLVSSFSPQALWRFRQRCPAVLTGFLSGPTPQAGLESLMAVLPHEARHPWHELIDNEYMDWARKNGYFVNAWTVNAPARALELQKLGLNAIITDAPAGLCAALATC